MSSSYDRLKTVKFSRFARSGPFSQICSHIYICFRVQYTRRLLLHKQTAILTVSYLCYLMEYTQGLETQDFESNLVKGTTHTLLCGLSKLLSTITIPCSKFTSCCYTPYDLYWMCFVVAHRAGHHSWEYFSKQLSSLETMSIAATA